MMKKMTITKFIRRVILILGLLGPVMLLSAPSADDAKLMILVTIAKQTSPLEIVGFKIPEKVGGPTVVVIHNISSKQVRDFVLGAVIGSPGIDGGPKGAQVGGTAFTNTEKRSQWGGERTISPGSSGEAHEYTFQPYGLAHFAKTLRSNCLLVAVLVVRVEYGDGTVWEMYDSHQDSRLWERSLQPVAGNSCRKSPEIEEVLSRLEGAAYDVPTFGKPTHASTQTVPSYSFSCSLVSDEKNRLTARCPF
jgi:hypothetical protein